LKAGPIARARKRYLAAPRSGCERRDDRKCSHRRGRAQGDEEEPAARLDPGRHEDDCAGDERPERRAREDEHPADEERRRKRGDAQLERPPGELGGEQEDGGDDGRLAVDRVRPEADSGDVGGADPRDPRTDEHGPRDDEPAREERQADEPERDRTAAPLGQRRRVRDEPYRERETRGGRAYARARRADRLDLLTPSIGTASGRPSTHSATAIPSRW